MERVGSNPDFPSPELREAQSPLLTLVAHTEQMLEIAKKMGHFSATFTGVGVVVVSRNLVRTLGTRE